MAQKVLVLVGDAAEELDAMYPIYRLREAGLLPKVKQIAQPGWRVVRRVARGLGWNLT